MPKSKAQRMESGPIVAHEYEMLDATLNVASITINGRYPETGFTSNLVSDSIVHVIDGAGLLMLSEGMMVELAKGDQVHLASGDEYCFEGSLEILYAATPAWTPAQTKSID